MLRIWRRVSTVTACSTLGKETAVPTADSTLSNQNPAPTKLSPPDYQQAALPPMDDAYLSSQADYHFTMGETLAYEGSRPALIEEFKTTLIYDPKSVHVRLRLALNMCAWE